MNETAKIIIEMVLAVIFLSIIILGLIALSKSTSLESITSIFNKLKP